MAVQIRVSKVLIALWADNLDFIDNLADDEVFNAEVDIEAITL